MKINALRVNLAPKKHPKHQVYASTVRIADLLDDHFVAVDHWKENRKPAQQGYQRSEDIKHVRDIRKSIEKNGTDFPTSVLLSVRRKSDGSTPVSYDTNKQILSIVEHPVYIVDGQHRIAGIKAAYKEGTLDDADLDAELGAMIMVGLDKFEEMEYFETVNNKSKKVKTDLANELLYLHATSDSSDERRLAATASDNKNVVRAVGVVHQLQKLEDSPWQNRIKLPNEDAKNGTGVASQGQLVSSLKPVLDGALKNDNLDEVVRVLNEYWSALRDIFPNAFLHPKKHVIQKTNGMFPLNRLLNDLIIKLLKERKELNKRSFKEKLHTIFSEVIDTNEFEHPVENSKYWQTGNTDGASLYRGQAGFKDLYNEFSSKLEE